MCQSNRERDLSITVGRTHRVPPHGPSHRSHRSGVSRHLSQPLVRDRLTKLHVPQKCVQDAAGEGVYDETQDTQERRERESASFNQSKSSG